jgi:single-strand DNA-binding protein
MNSVTLIGHIGQTPTKKTFDSGRSVSQFSLATNRKVGENETTTWHNIVAWGYLAERDLRKGDKVVVTGYIQNRDYEKDGHKHRHTEIVAYSLDLIQNRINHTAPPSTDDDPFAPKQEKPDGKVMTNEELLNFLNS